MAKEKIATSLPKCASCKCDVGAEVGIIPFFVDDGGEKAKHEPFCPTCFVYVRSPREPYRFTPGAYAAVKCGGCGKTSVAIGSDRCMQCGSRSVLILPPKIGVA